jgi:hypothetical protein
MEVDALKREVGLASSGERSVSPRQRAGPPQKYKGRH